MNELNEEHLEKCWEILSDADMKLNLRFTGHEYTDNILLQMQKNIEMHKEQLKLLNKLLMKKSIKK